MSLRTGLAQALRVLKETIPALLHDWLLTTQKGIFLFKE